MRRPRPSQPQPNPNPKPNPNPNPNPNPIPNPNPNPDQVAYYTAGVAVVHDFSASQEAPRNRQRFFQSHDDDILCTLRTSYRPTGDILKTY